MTLNERVFESSSFIQIQNGDWKCMARAVVEARARIEARDGKITESEYKYLTELTESQTEEAAKLLLHY